MSGGSRRDSLGGGEGLFKRLLQELSERCGKPECTQKQ